MTITKTISLANWQDVVSGGTGNPIAGEEMLAMARAEDLLVEDDGRVFAPLERGGAWDLEPLLTEDQVADLLRISVREAQRLLIEASVPVFRTRERLLLPQQLWSESELKKKLESYTASHGLEPREAALELGVTLASCQPLVSQVPYHTNGRAQGPARGLPQQVPLPRQGLGNTNVAGQGVR